VAVLSFSSKFRADAVIWCEGFVERLGNKKRAQNFFAKLNVRETILEMKLGRTIINENERNELL
jgi:hypothetical protein